MARKDELIKSKTFYTLRKKHTSVFNGEIFENDHVTIVSDDDIYDDDMYLFSDSNFKFRIPEGNKNRKKHSRGTWLKAPNQVPNKEFVWTLNDIPQIEYSDNYKIVIKPNYSSFSDFAYYGSAVELLKATVNDIILRYPGCLSYWPKEIAPTIKLGDTTYYFVSNECDLDFWSKSANESNYDLNDSMKILSLSYDKYIDGFGRTIKSFSSVINSSCLGTIIGTLTIGHEYNNNKTILSIYLDGNGKKHLIFPKNDTTYPNENIIMQPNSGYTESFWNSLDDFEKMLLDRTTKPIYTAKIETPYIQDYKHFYEYKNYTWPTVDGLNPDLTSVSFQGYLNGLMDIAEYYDEYESDNLYRMNTHEAIKNMDYSIINSDYDEFDNSKMAAMLRIHGRLYDDIKRYIDNIKNSNRITYDGENNLPDYFLTDNLDINGWNVKSVNEFTKNSVSNNVFSGSTSSGMTASEIDTLFMRNLSISSHYLMSLKGTRRGVEAMLGMFGYRSGNNLGDYKITEYIAVAQTFPEYDDWEEIVLESDKIQINEFDYDILENPQLYYPISVAIASDNKSYLIPWFDKRISKKTGFYFQQKGGWGKLPRKQIKDLPFSHASEITKYDTPIYMETLPYLSFANDIFEMTSMDNNLVYDNMICYVTDIESIYDENFYKEEGNRAADNQTPKDYSHYFILENKMLSNHVGFVSNKFYNCYGWRNIHLSEFLESTLTEDGARVLYLETLELSSQGNNPHCGFGNYDDGDSYLYRYNHIFEENIANGDFDLIKESNPTKYNNILSFGFNVSENLIEDNKKCYYFGNFVGDTAVTSESSTTQTLTVGGETQETHGQQRATTNASTTSTIMAIGQKEKLSDVGYYSKLNSYQGYGNKYEEPYADSILNVKKMRISFNVGRDQNGCLRDYLQNVVFKYVNEMIPSTTILEFEFVGNDSHLIIPESGDTQVSYSTIHSIVADMAVVGNTDTYFIESEI